MAVRTFVDILLGREISRYDFGPYHPDLVHVQYYVV